MLLQFRVQKTLFNDSGVLRQDSLNAPFEDKS